MHASISEIRQRLAGATPRFALIAITLFALGALPVAHAQTVPAAVVSSIGYVDSVNSAFGTTDYGGNSGRPGVNSRGDVIFVDANNTYGAANDGFVVVVPANGGQGAQYQVLFDLGYNSHGLSIDANNNLYVGDTNSNIFFIPFINNAYPSTPTDAASMATPNCNMPIATSTNTVTCKVPLDPTYDGYYIQVEDLQVDASGNIYVVDKYDGYTGGAYNRIMEFYANGSSSQVFQDLLGTSNDQNATLAVDSQGGVYYASPAYLSNGVTYFPASSATGEGNQATGTVIGSGLKQPAGVSLDKGGNLYIVDSYNPGPSQSKIYEIPSGGTYPVSGTQYTLLNFTGESQYGNGLIAQNAVGIDSLGGIYYVGSYGNSINHATIANSFTSYKGIGSTSGDTQLNVAFNAAETVTGYAGVGGVFAVDTINAPGFGTQCAATTYAAGGNCTLNVTFTPTLAGLQTTEFGLTTSTGTVGGTLLSGIGLGAVLNVDPGTVSAIGSGWTAPAGIALDNVGNTYVTDASTGKVYRTPGSGGTPAAIVSGLTSPTGIAVDAFDNLYVAESTKLVAIPYSGTSYGSPVTLATGLSTPGQVALDAGGNLYVADTGNSRVLRVTNYVGQPEGAASVVSFGTGFESPTGVAVDTGNNYLYVGDAGTGKVTQIGLNTGNQTQVVSGITTPAGLAVDANGDLFVVDSGAKTITRVPNTGGAGTLGTGVTLATVVADPAGIAVDNNGDVFATDTTNAKVSEMNRSTGALSFGTVNLNSTSSELDATISNGGNEPLGLNATYYTASGSTAFVVTGDSTCTDSETINQAASCTVDATFTPTVSGPLSGSLSFSSSAVNAASLALSGSGAASAAATTTVFSSSPSTLLYGETATLKATVTSSGGTPSGSVAFYTGTDLLATENLLNGVATLVAPTTAYAPGTYPITAKYLGNTSFAASQGTGNVVLSKATSTTVFSATPSAATVGQTVSLKATVTTSSGAGTATGSVTFSTNGITLGTANLVGGVATLSASSTGQPIGTYSVKAQYNGSTYVGTSSGTGNVSLKYATTTGLTATPNPVAGNGTVTLKATVAATTGGTPTGSVTFSSNGTTLATVNLVSGVASLTAPVSAYPAGTYPVIATYTGSSSDATSVSSTVNVVVQ
jgi:sugar lactone lactonase YvrE